jgi:asparagine synthase (glutamine-hydrolysing)
VSFSGGRDSSAVLAAAAYAARREGLPLPIPATNRFPVAAHTDESAWQELVVRHVGVHDWVRRDFTDELDVVGSVATRVLRRHGVLWPFNTHFHVPLLEAARGGSLLTGIGGDEVFGTTRWQRAIEVISLRVTPRRRDAARIALLASPRPLRRRVLARRCPAVFPWLTSDALARLARDWAADEASEPARLRRRIEWVRGRRWLEVGAHSMELVARDAGAKIAHPLLSPEFGAALVAAAPRHGFDDRGRAMAAVFDDALPPELLSRTSKARFEGAFWAAPSTALAESFETGPFDPSVVDTSALRTVWARREPDAHTFLLMQALWLVNERGAKKGHLDLRPVAAGTDAA